MKKLAVLILTLVVPTLGACVSIPAEAPELSATLGVRISAIEQSHLTLLHRYFDMKRRDVDRFVDQVWVPPFAERLFKDPAISKTWDQIVSSGNRHDRLQFIVRLGPKLQQKINQKRLELIQPLDALERRIQQKIEAEYDQARSINNTLTSFLTSASEVAENRNRYLAMLGVKDEKMGQVIDQVDDAVTDLLGGVNLAAGAVSTTEGYLKTLRELRNSIN